MLKIKIITIGGVKEKSYNGLINEFLKRLRPYAKVEILELKAESFKRESDKEKAKKIEGERILKSIEKCGHTRIFLLEEEGREFNSLEFANFLEKDTREIIFVIAGTLGFSLKVKEKIKISVSLSRLTFPHEMARVVLFEQIYRGITINKNKKYHY
jgi:23S rRNA (pseudouridine1915-N3)-methyltransferase